MSTFNLDEVKYYLEENSDLVGYKGRTRHILDRRNYLMHILYKKFKLSEEEVSDILKTKRGVIHHSKYHAYLLKDDKDFALHTEHIKKRFPYQARKPPKPTYQNSITRYTIKLDKQELAKLKIFKDKHECHTHEEAIRKMIRIY